MYLFSNNRYKYNAGVEVLNRTVNAQPANITLQPNNNQLIRNMEVLRQGDINITQTPNNINTPFSDITTQNIPNFRPSVISSHSPNDTKYITSYGSHAIMLTVSPVAVILAGPAVKTYNKQK